MVAPKFPILKKRLHDAIHAHSLAKGTPGPGTKGIQQWLAREIRKKGISVTPQGVGRWTRGEVMPREHVFIALAQILGVSVPYLRGYGAGSDSLWSRMEQIWNDLADDGLRSEVVGYAEGKLEKKPEPGKTKTARP